ncbi:MAG: C69 family dipeptidase, partial [Phycisphaerae bacterium]|nr:C69 family dipeptidase [Phycisphaerae bacterium]
WKGSRLATPYPSAKLQRKFKVRFVRPIAVQDCSHGFVAQSRPWLPDSIGGAGWFYLDNPHTSCFAPIYAGTTSFPKSWRTYDRRKSSRESARWAFDKIDNMTANRYQDNIRELMKVRTPLENEFFARKKTVEAAALEAHKRSPAQAAKILTDFTNASMRQAEKTYWDLIDTLTAKYEDK